VISGLVGGRAKGKKSLVAVAVETHPGRQALGRARLAVIPDASSPTLKDFLVDSIEPGSTVVTDAWKGYSSHALTGYIHQVVNQSQAHRDHVNPDDLLPGVNRVIALLKRWLAATHQGPVSAGHLQDYLDEWVFRFNRRSSKKRGLLFYRLIQLAVGHDPVRYTSLIHQPATDTGGGQDQHSHGSGGHPDSLERPPPGYPWRLHHANVV